MNKIFCAIVFIIFSILPASGMVEYTVDSTRLDSTVVQQKQIDTAFFGAFREMPEFDYGKSYQEKIPTLWQRFWRTFFMKLRTVQGFYHGMTIAVKTFFWLLVIAILVFAISKIRFQRFFYTKNEKEDRGYVLEDADETIEDLVAAIENEVQNKNFRKAIRYQFLDVLRKLNSNGVLTLSAEKTNFDYLNELRKKTESAHDFQVLINIYNAVWYGHFNIDEDDYLRLSMSFTTFKTNVHA